MRSYGEPEHWLAYTRPEEEEDSLEGLLHDKVQCLSDLLGQIQREREQRVALSTSVIQSVYQQYLYVTAKLLEALPGGSQTSTLRRNTLEKELDSLKREVRRERVECWKDVELLNKEFRTWLKQYTDLVQKLKLLMPTDKQ